MTTDDRGPAVDPIHGPEPAGLPTDPACPHCGSGPVVPTPIGTVCKSCARTVGTWSAADEDHAVRYTDWTPDDGPPPPAPQPDQPCPIGGEDTPCVLPADHHGRCLR